VRGHGGQHLAADDVLGPATTNSPRLLIEALTPEVCQPASIGIVT